MSPTLSRDNVFAHLETTKKTRYNKKDNLRRYTQRRGNYGKITTQFEGSFGGEAQLVVSPRDGPREEDEDGPVHTVTVMV